MKWIRVQDELPPLYKRVLIWTNDSYLRAWDGTWIQSYLMARVPEPIFGNHILPYSYRCENSEMEYGHNVTHWAEIEGPDAQ